ncbi:MAG: hypothetical protein ACMXYD_05805 [Candidatus Woesearchaeota archaeon]
MVRRAQVSVEFLLIIGLAMLLMTASTAAIFQFTQSETDANNFAQVASFGQQLLNQANNMYVYGTGSFVVVSGSLPQQTTSAYIVDDVLIFELATRRGIVPVQLFSTIPINGSEPGEKQYLNVSGTNLRTSSISVRVESKGNYVQLRQVS